MNILNLIAPSKTCWTLLLCLNSRSSKPRTRQRAFPLRRMSRTTVLEDPVKCPNQLWQHNRTVLDLEVETFIFLTIELLIYYWTFGNVFSVVQPWTVLTCHSRYRLIRLRVRPNDVETISVRISITSHFPSVL
jgi:hypothetical protein